MGHFRFAPLVDWSVRWHEHRIYGLGLDGSGEVACERRFLE
jgi:hypothetical protein